MTLRHVLVLSSCFAAIASVASAQATRVSVSTAGVEANGVSINASVSASGRFVVFDSRASNLVAGDGNQVDDVFLRDRDTDADGVFDEAGAVSTTRLSVGPGGAELDDDSFDPHITPDGRFVAFVSSATNLLPGGPAGVSQVYRLDRTTNAVVRVSESVAGVAGDAGSVSPSISADGNVVVFLSGASNLEPQPFGGSAIYVRVILADATTRIPAPFAPGAPGATLDYGQTALSADGNRVGYIVREIVGPSATRIEAHVYDRSMGVTIPVPTAPYPPAGIGISASGRLVVVQTSEGVIRRRVVDTGAETPSLPVTMVLSTHIVSPSGRYSVNFDGRLGDFEFGTSTPLGIGSFAGAFSADDRWLAASSGSATLVAGDTNGVSDAFVIDLPDFLDADDDTMDDRWEATFGVTDPGADPDGDGQTNAQEENAGTHPNGTVRRYLAEGATGTFFTTTVTLANPDLANAAVALVRFNRGDGTTATMPVSLPAAHSAAIDVGSIPGFEAADVSMTIESNRLVSVDRRMAWDTAAFHGARGYGSHGETATASPSTTWFLAEGSTVLEFNLFYLLQNPQATVAHTTVRFLLPDGTVVSRTYDLAPHSRTTIYVNQVPGLDETDVSGDISSDVGIIVERSMYRNLLNQPFGLGTESMGVTAPATRWFLAEGATGTFFDQYVLIANPGNADAQVTAEYARQDGTIVTRQHTVRAHSRFSIFVDAIPGLEATTLATTVTSTNGVPIVVERAMYWPNGFFSYYEGHSSAGSTTTAQRWVVADGNNDPQSNTYVLIANTENRAGEVELRALPRVNEDTFAPPPLTVQLPPNSRTTVPTYVLGGVRPYGVLVTSTGPSPVALVVESAKYRSTDVVWSSGSNALATPVP